MSNPPSPERPMNIDESFGIGTVSPRRFSMVKGENPLDAKTNGNRTEGADTTSSSYKVEKLSNATNITEVQLQELIDTLKSLQSNELRIEHLKTSKNAYLFASKDLLKMILDITPSVKTRICFIELIGQYGNNNYVLNYIFDIVLDLIFV